MTESKVKQKEQPTENKSKREILKSLTRSGCIVKKEAGDLLKKSDYDKIEQLEPKPMVISPGLIKKLREKDQPDFEEFNNTSVEILNNVEELGDKIDTEEFVEYFNSRFEQYRDLLMNRRELRDTTSINRAQTQTKGDEITVIGMVRDKYQTKKGKYIVYLEDPTGDIKVLASKDEGESIVNDEVIGVRGSLGGDIIFADSIVWPDIPIPKNISKTDEEVYAAFISDLHLGSKDTLEGKLDSFVEWVNSGEGITRRLKYLFISGDAVEGIGIYQGQDDDLKVEDIYQQYELFQDFVKRLRDDLKVIILPGNHDIVRLGEPQPPLPKRVLPDLHEKENVYMVSNPSKVRIHNKINVLAYHGYSLDDFIDSIPYLREKGYDEPKLAMIELLKKRHLAPSYGSNLISPKEKDHLLIDFVPDIFVMGHIHSFTCDNYKGVNLLCSSTFQAQTDFQKKIGHIPDPGKVALVNLQTRKSVVKVI